MIHLNENLVGIWFVGLPGSDWLASISKVDGEATLVYRFRYHVDDKSFDSEDRKNWYQCTIPASGVERLVDDVRTLAKLMELNGGEEAYELLMEDFDDVDAFMDQFKQMPFVSYQTEKLQ